MHGIELERNLKTRLIRERVAAAALLLATAAFPEEAERSIERGSLREGTSNDGLPRPDRRDLLEVTAICAPRNGNSLRVVMGLAEGGSCQAIRTRVTRFQAPARR